MLIRSTAPQFNPPIYNPFPAPTRDVFDNGINIYSFNNGDQEVFKIELLFSAGSYHVANASVASLCMEMLREGSSKRTGEEINALLDYYGSFIDLKAGLDHCTIGFYGRSEFLTQLLPLLAEIVLDPSFEESALEDQKQKMAQNIKINQKKTSYWSGRLLRKSLFGEDHGYSKLISIEDIAAVSVSDLREYHRNVLIPGLTAIIIAGSYDANLLNHEIEKYFGQSTVLKNDNKVNSGSTTKDHTISKSLENTSQASIALGRPVLSNAELNYPVQSILIKILGGYFGSRLMKTLREDKGLTYGVHAYTNHLLGGSYLQIAADVELKSVDYSVELIFKELNKLRKHGVSDEELFLVKNYMLGEYVNDSNTVFDFASLYKKVILQNLPETYFENFYSSISAIDSDSMLHLAQEVFNPDDFYTVKIV